jgi:hypothetical protein
MTVGTNVWRLKKQLVCVRDPFQQNRSAASSVAQRTVPLGAFVHYYPWIFAGD